MIKDCKKRQRKKKKKGEISLAPKTKKLEKKLITLATENGHLVKHLTGIITSTHNPFHEHNRVKNIKIRERGRRVQLTRKWP